MTTEKKREYRKQWYQKNKKKFLEKLKQHYHENNERYKEYSKQYYQENKEKVKEYKKKYRQKYQKEIKERNAIQRQIKQNKTSFCECCGYIEKIINVNHSHHIIPKCAGGVDNKENRITLCPTCHEIAHKLVKIKGGRYTDKMKIVQQTNPQYLTRQGLIDGIKECL